VAVLHKALDVLECLAAGPLTAADISKRIGVAKPTVYRLLNTLQSRDWVARDAEGTRYQLGSAAMSLGSAAGSEAGLVSLVRPFMTGLAASYDETVNLAIMTGGQILYLDVLQSGHRPRTEIPVGSRDHLHSTALGKAILAALPDREARAILSTVELVPATPSTITAIPALLRQFTAIRQAGYAVDHEENEIGSVCVASVIRGLDGRPVGALSISGPKWRVDDQQVKVMGAELVAICSSLSDVFSLGGARPQPASPQPASPQPASPQPASPQPTEPEPASAVP
jgi:IclR family acetate operon transcriptional repressor